MKFMKKYLIFSFLFILFAMQNKYDNSSITEGKSQSYTLEGNKETAYTKSVSPITFLRYFGFVFVLQSYRHNIFTQSLNLGTMQNKQEKKGFERGEVSPPQTAALSQYLQFVARELPEVIQNFDELFIAYLGSDFCTSQGENERSNTGFHFFKLRAFLSQLYTPPQEGGEQV
jgi:hypothetical protein